jgi:type II secretory ATPase GspE/PulE/Tfp pilus assembly ATPase PilB-like protein/8-oxo-dGTP pyrophosphatase MutT (NUDIX family)
MLVIPIRPSAEPLRDAWLAPVLIPVLGGDGVDVLVREADGSLWETVVGRGLLSEDALVQHVARHFRLAVADLAHVSTRAVELIPERWARRFGVLPFALDENVLVIATANPCDVECERALAFAAGRAVRFAIASADAISERIDAVYGGEESATPSASSGDGEDERHVEVQMLSGESENYDDASVVDEGPSVSRLVDDILGAGIVGRASDIHIEPEEQGIVVRHRVDGLIRVVRRLPRSLAPALASRIKIVSGLDIADRLRPQDGRARVAVDGVAVDLRVSTLPASHGEKIVIRILDGRTSVRTLDAIGFAREELARIQRLLQAREGLVLVTGPTGSGKTTTLYAALRQLKQRAVNIVTVEDPIEYRLPGVVQVQVRERAGLTFASALRSIMRQDPDVLLIGEIRDRETAEIAIQASLTGHLVLSTLHTNDAASAVTRLLDIGVEPYKIATALKGVLAQRLLRRLCVRCRRHVEAAARAAGVLGTYEAVGCRSCGDTGYHGRLAIVEVLIVTPELERCIAAGESTERLAETARQDGMLSLWQSGLARVHAGDTTEEDLVRVAAPDATRSQTEILNASGPAAGVPEIDYLAPPTLLSSPLAEPSVSQLSIGTVDVYVIRPLASGWRVLVLQRALDTRCPTAWETVHGHIETGEEPEEAALREVREECGLAVSRLYNVTVQPFYLHKTHTVEMAVVFAAFVDEPASLTLGIEHQRAEWLSLEDALERFQWPREREALREALHLLRGGDAGPVEDVLRVR